jgi:NADPH2:quinone reductase
LRAHELTGPDALWVDEVPDPVPPGGDVVRIDVYAAGIGFVDTLVARGRYQVRQEPPYVPGMEVAGVVSLAPENSGFGIGQAVTAIVPCGGCAEIAWAQAHLTAPQTGALSFVQEAAMVVNFHTALVGLTRRAGLRPGERVLVHGAGGGLGGAFVQIAAALDATVSGVAGSDERRALAAAAGAGTVYGPDEWLGAVRDSGGADVIVDPVGGDVFDRSLRCLAPEGRLLTVGFTSGTIPSAPANCLLLRNASVVGVGLIELLRSDRGLFARTAQRLAGLVDAGLRPMPAAVHPLADAGAAFRAIEDRTVMGKAVIQVR